MGLKKTNAQQGYDLIGDIHGCGQSLERLLQKMGYQPMLDTYGNEEQYSDFKAYCH